MIWGLTNAERTAKFEASWHAWFAWRRVWLEDGRSAWLCMVERKWFNDEHGNWAGDSSRWMYRA